MRRTTGCSDGAGAIVDQFQILASVMDGAGGNAKNAKKKQKNEVFRSKNKEIRKP